MAAPLPLSVARITVRAMPSRRRRPLGWIALVALFLFMGFVVWRTFHLQGVRCEVCITYRGLSQCRTVEGERREDAHQAAVSNVCAYLASGVTDGMACMRTPPTHDECSEID
jgi:ferric-dicitrate binding protein FerR (iron transport regulator)